MFFFVCQIYLWHYHLVNLFNLPIFELNWMLDIVSYPIKENVLVSDVLIWKLFCANWKQKLIPPLDVWYRVYFLLILEKSAVFDEYRLIFQAIILLSFRTIC